MDLRKAYLELIKKSLLNELYVELEAQLLYAVLCASHGYQLDLDGFWRSRADADLLETLAEAKTQGDTILLQGKQGDRIQGREDLRNYTEYAHTMIGRRRLDHLQLCVETVLKEEVRGDLVETGVWRGGSCILMKAVLAANTVSERKVWVVDSFAGLPAPSHAEDTAYDMSREKFPFLAVSLDQVRELFNRYDLLDDQVKFLPGWFRDSLPQAPIQRIAVLRIDADLFESTSDALTMLYSKVSKGGYIIIDDYRVLPPCKRAVDSFRMSVGIQTPLKDIDNYGVFWRKS